MHVYTQAYRYVQALTQQTYRVYIVTVQKCTHDVHMQADTSNLQQGQSTTPPTLLCSSGISLHLYPSSLVNSEKLRLG